MTRKVLKGRTFFSVVSALFLILFLSGVCSVYSAEKGKVKGTVIDQSSKAALPGITVSVEGTDVMVYTDENGKYELDLPPGTYKMRAELLGYKPSEALNVTVIEEETANIDFMMEEALVVRGEEVVVTGERLNVPLSKTTASVSVISSKAMDKITGATNAADLLKDTPGLNVESGGAEYSKTIKIRGRTVAPPRTASAGILLLIDGIPANDPATGMADVYRIPSGNIERIEILKGASSAQYGGQAAAGVINIITKKGQKNPLTKVKAELGTFQRRSGAERELLENYTFFHSWGNKYFDYALTGTFSHMSGMTTAETEKIGNAYKLYAELNPGKSRLPDGRKKFINRIESAYRIGENLNKMMDDGDRDKGERYSINLDLGVYLFKNNILRINPSYQLTYFYNPYSPGNIPIQNESDTFQLFFLRVFNRTNRFNVADKWDITPNLTFNTRLGLQKSTSITDFQFVNDFIDYNAESEALGKKDRFIGGEGDSPFLSTISTYINRGLSFAADATYKLNVLGGNATTVGYEYLWSKSTSPDGSYTELSVKNNTHSLFLQNMLVIEDLTFSVGARWDQRTTFIDDFDDEVSPRFGVNYSISPGTSLRFSVGRARRFPEFLQQYSLGGGGGRSWGNTNIGPEINWTYELGFKFDTKYFGGDIAYFYDRYSDFEIPLPVNALGYEDGGAYSEAVLGVSRETLAKLGIRADHPRAGITVNGPNVVFQGFDTAFDIRPTENWDMNVSYLFQRAIIGQPNPFDFSQGTNQSLWVASDGKTLGPKFQGGNRIIYIPTHTLKLGSGYTFPFGLRADLKGIYKSNVKFISGVFPGGIFKQQEHWVWDFKMAQTLLNGKLKVTFSIENILSKLYYEAGGIPSNVAKYVFGVEANF